MTVEIIGKPTSKDPKYLRFNRHHEFCLKNNIKGDDIDLAFKAISHLLVRHNPTTDRAIKDEMERLR